MSILSFSIANLHAVSSYFSTIKHWQQWAKDDLNINTLPEVAPDVSFIPAIQRRRLSLSARMVFASVYPLQQYMSDSPIIMVSHDGEINRSFDMMLALYGNNEVSPTSFGLSVHNALIGQLSMWYNNRSESNAISSHDACWEYGIVEACGLLADGAKNVVLICTDNPLNKEYTIKARRSPFAYAIAIVLTQGDDWQLSFQAGNHSTPHLDYWGGLTWLKNYLNQTTTWTQHYSRESWVWNNKTIN